MSMCLDKQKVGEMTAPPVDEKRKHIKDDSHTELGQMDCNSVMTMDVIL